MKIVITGSNGFTGKNLFKILKSRFIDSDIIPLDLNYENSINNKILDFCDYNQVNEFIENEKPDQIYHLVGTLSNTFEIDFQSNLVSTKNIINSVISNKLKTRILLIGSSAEYGLVNQKDNPIHEDYPLNPVSIYGLTKVYQTHLMKYYFQTFGIDLVMARTFNLKGHGISDKLFIGNVYKQIQDYKNNKISKIILGYLENKRDYINIEDAIQDYILIMNSGTSGEVYNIGSGFSLKMKDILINILTENNLTIDIVESIPYNNYGKIDIPDLVANISKIKNLRKSKLA